MQIRSATERDIPFLVEAIIEAEKSGTEVLSYARIFGLNEAEVRELLAQILEEDMPGQELCVSGFAIAEVEGEAVAAVCAWVEGEEEMPSGIIKGNLLAYYLPEANLQIGIANQKHLEGFNLHRTSGVLQLESIYTKPAFRGRGFVGKLISQQEADFLAKKPGLKYAEIALMGDNVAALRAYEKQGFGIKERVEAKDETATQFMPGKVKILMQKQLA